MGQFQTFFPPSQTGAFFKSGGGAFSVYVGNFPKVWAETAKFTVFELWNQLCGAKNKENKENSAN